MLFDEFARERHTARAIKRLSDHIDGLMLQLSEASAVPKDFPCGQLAAAKADLDTLFKAWAALGNFEPWWHVKYHDEASKPARLS